MYQQWISKIYNKIRVNKYNKNLKKINRQNKSIKMKKLNSTIALKLLRKSKIN